MGLILLISACSKKDIKTLDEPVAETEAVGERKCASQEVLAQQVAANPTRAQFLEQLETFTKDYKGRALENARFAGKLYIPVVVHVVHKNPDIVSNSQILSQVAVLNKDFTKTNAELSNSNVYLAGYNFNNVANCNIEFVVTQVVRKATTLASFGTNDAVKRNSAGGSDAQNATTHLNLWVCDLSSGLLGYAQFPGGSASTDGVVIDLQAFGTSSSYALYSTFNLGRTATHEVGHWLNLRHIWGDARCGNDLVGDTPSHDASNGGCPATSHRSRCAGKPLEQWMNYMDYTDDRCMYMFTAGQKTRMDAAIDAARQPYVLTTKPTSVL